MTAGPCESLAKIDLIIRSERASRTSAVRGGASLVSYSVKFVCGIQDADELKVGMVRPGIYATEINIHNYNNTEVRVRKLVLPLVIGGEPQGREPRFVGVANQDNISLPP